MQILRDLSDVSSFDKAIHRRHREFLAHYDGIPRIFAAYRPTDAPLRVPTLIVICRDDQRGVRRNSRFDAFALMVVLDKHALYLTNKGSKPGRMVYSMSVPLKYSPSSSRSSGTCEVIRNSRPRPVRMAGWARCAPV